jgi:hypothetical protein
VTILVMLGAGVAAAQSDADRQGAKDAIVMIRTQLPGGTQMGAGIIVATTQREVYVVTANHMVRRGGVASSIELQFASAPGRWVTASLLDFRDVDLDLAAVVTPLPQNFNAASLKTVLAAPPRQLRREMDVFALGYPRERAWNLPVLADKIATTTAYRIVFQSSFVQPGNSGGALLDACGRIVGMVIETDPPEATAVRIESVLDAVKSWNLPTQPSLSTSAGTCGTPVQAAQTAVAPVTQPAPAPAAPTTCDISLSSTPTGSDVYLDDTRTGTTPRVVTLQRGRFYEIRIQKSGYESFERQVDCTSGTVRAALDPATTNVTLNYAGDYYGCVLQIQVKIGTTTAVPTSNSFTMQNVPLGRQNYTINGQIGCTALNASCVARGQGTITVDVDDVYNVVWSNPAIAQCAVSLIKQ